MLLDVCFQELLKQDRKCASWVQIMYLERRKICTTKAFRGWWWCWKNQIVIISLLLVFYFSFFSFFFFFTNFYSAKPFSIQSCDHFNHQFINLCETTQLHRCIPQKMVYKLHRLVWFANRKYSWFSILVTQPACTCNEAAKIKELSKTSLVVSLQKLFFQSVSSKTRDVTYTL